MIGMCIFFVLPVFKCSVSCGTGIQVRKIDCVLPASVNGSHTDHLRSHNHRHDNNNNNNEKNDHIESLSSDAASNGPIDASMQILSNEQISMDCDPKLKPIATQSCTTGIECTTIINDNIGSSGHEEADRITNASNENEQEIEIENENENESENENENRNENDNTEIDNDGENTSPEADNVEEPEEVSVDQNAYDASVESTNENVEVDTDDNTENVGAERNLRPESEETDEQEVFFWGQFTLFCSFYYRFSSIFFLRICMFLSFKITNITNFGVLI